MVSITKFDDNFIIWYLFDKNSCYC